METKQIMVALTAGDSPALGNIWRITAKKTDFYLDPLGQDGTIAHLSVHGSNERFDGHRFHIKVDRQFAATAKDRGHFVGHGVPRKGFIFDGQQLAAHAFRVARLRWTWDLQRAPFRAAAVSGPAPELADHQSGARLSKVLSPNDAWDIDLGCLLRPGLLAEFARVIARQRAPRTAAQRRGPLADRDFISPVAEKVPHA